MKTITNISDKKILEGKLSETYQHLRETISLSLIDTPRDINILIVDDDEADRMSVIRSLKAIEGSQYTVKEAMTHEEALENLKNTVFDVCLIDYRLNEGTAFDLLEQLGNEQKTPFILLSGHISDELRDKAIRLGIYDSIDKDVLTPHLLERCIRYTMRHCETESYLTQHKAND